MEDTLNLPIQNLLQIMQERIVKKTTYFGVRTLKGPIDYWVYQEIIYEQKPDFIIEIGNRFGGSTLALAHLCDLMRQGQVIGLDITHEDIHLKVIEHPRITLFEGDACLSFEKVRELVPLGANVLVIEDSAHTFENTLNVLNTFSPLVLKGGYFIVEDGICHHGLGVGPNPGPYEAIEAFINQNSHFEIDREREAFFITWNPKGYLRRIS
jgi:cephalosporin hydroxylase